MDDLNALVAQLEQEHATLSARVRRAEEERERQLAVQATRLAAAEGRIDAAQEQHEKMVKEAAALEDRRDHAQRRVKQLGGRLWMIAHSSGVMASFITGLATIPALAVWHQGSLVLWQAGLLIGGLVLIPRRS